MQLFRQQAVDAQAYRLYGDVFLQPLLSHRVCLGLLLLWFSAATFWLARGEYASRETVQGWLRPMSGVTRVYAPSMGIIEEIFVKEGQYVTNGQPLFVLNSARTLRSGNDANNEMLREFNFQKSKIEDRLHRTQENHHEQRQHTLAQIKTARNELEISASQLNTIKQRQQIFAQQLARYTTLADQGHITSTRLESAQMTQLELDGSRQALLQEREHINNRIAKLETELSLQPAYQAEQSEVLQMSLSKVLQEIIEIRERQSRVVTAPRAGIVHNLQARAGQHTGVSGAPLVSIVPRNAILEAQLLIPVRAVGFVEPGQSLNINYDAFPHQKFGSYAGIVTHVADSAELPHEIAGAPLNPTVAVYRVSASITHQQAEGFGRAFELKPGMTFSADISLGKRTLLQWLLNPIHALRGALL